MSPLPLSRASLPALRADIGRPAYVPARVAAGIVHLGLGGFHRAHMARYTCALMNAEPTATEWGIIGVGLLPADRRMLEALEPQDGLCPLIERQDESETATVIGSLCRVIFAGESSRAVIEAITDRAVRIVSLTSTENGYCLNPATRQLDFNHPAIVHHLAHPHGPRSAIGILVESYRCRKQRGLPAFTALSCDNIQHNGAVLCRAVLAVAERQDPSLADWITREASFPRTMVDRITPVTMPEDIADLASSYGIADRWPVVSERYTRWVVEDAFVAGRPEWERVGAQFVDDVQPYEMMKLRLLNASHLGIAGLGRLAGYTHIDEALPDQDIRSYMQASMDRETGPTLPPLPGVDLTAYKAELVVRFSNRRIKDTVDRVNADAPINLLLDPIRDRLAAGAPIELLALALAAWLRRVRGEDEAGQPLVVAHPLAGLLREKALEGGADPRALLSIKPLFGNLGESPGLIGPVERWLRSLYASGARVTLAQARKAFTS
ncbi:mannitol dehydrogenase family protein [Novosphingobium sp. 9U]|uniref:mannitol dehydrogenase family protein n=1 Tax=Novosphingobium sp. 9U TaxID=2653158 RepID=UPI0012EF2583|nr:mannitol dehydrogenase family protein [Novosphingobium sp. 9U]VWX46769.1 D-mannonate oxidoreductase [Novosphingobium sp. 9U]